MSPAPLNLSAGDFDAYRPERATSNAYSRPRIEVKQRAMAWGRRVAERLGAMGIAVDLCGSDEHPTLRNHRRVDTQWIFFWRDEKAREELDRLLDQGRSIAATLDDPSPYRRHAFLALRIDAQAVEVCCAVHPEATVDVDNLRARLRPADEAEAPLATELTEALHRLPEQFAIGVGRTDAPTAGPELAGAPGAASGAAAVERVACAAADAATVAGMLERAAAGQVPLWIGWSLPREVALEHAAILDEQLETAILALAPIYRLVAWSRDNDHIALDRRLEGAQKERARHHAEVQAETERWRASREAATARSREAATARSREAAQARSTSARIAAQPLRPSLSTLFSSPAGRRDGRGAPARPPAAPPRADAERDLRLDRAPGDRAPEAAAGASLEKGARVRVLSGPFADKLGVVSELDGRGGARVLLGLLSTRLELADMEIVVDGRDRPPLQSSHRRPAAPPPRKAR